MSWLCRASLRRLGAGVLALNFAAPLVAQQPSVRSVAATDATRTTNYRPAETNLPAENQAHPMAAVIDYARRQQDYFNQAVRDFTCRMVKRERINGFLQDYQHVDMWVREGIHENGRIVQPLSIFLEFVGPAKVAGRRVLYIEGQHDGKMLVRNGGRHFEYVVVELDPFGDAVQDESLVPITETGFNRVLGRMIDVLERHAKIDAAGVNTKVQRISGAKLNQRPCSVVRITHPQKQEGLEFHIANVFVDDELRVPVRVDFSDFPKRPDQPPPLLAEYTYTNLQLNVGLPDSTFSPARLKSR